MWRISTAGRIAHGSVDVDVSTWRISTAGRSAHGSVDVDSLCVGIQVLKGSGFDSRRDDERVNFVVL